jgi:hypothetical protein
MFLFMKTIAFIHFHIFVSLPDGPAALKSVRVSQKILLA